MRCTARFFTPLLIGLILSAAQSRAADHPWQINSADAKSSVTFGFLGQTQGEAVRNKTGAANSQDLFIRRFRLIAGGNFTEKFSFFIDSDSPNLGKGIASGAKVDEKVFLQDVVLTYAFKPQFQLEGGLLLLGITRNAGQGATSLLAIDYGPYTFIASDPTGSRIGRDYGLEARGYLSNNHFEYRAGVFQGSRSSTSGSFRYFGRAVWYPFEAETSYFYSGTTLGTRKILAIGGSLDHQKDYTTGSADVFYDQPLPGKNSITLQASYSRFDGGRTFVQLPPEHVWFVESGYYNSRAKVGPFVQMAGRNFVDKSRNDLRKFTGGLAYWPMGHRLNVKLGAARASGDIKQDFWQFVMQAQIFVY